MENDINQQLEWLAQELDTSIRSAANRTEWMRLTQMRSRLEYITALAAKPV